MPRGRVPRKTIHHDPSTCWTRSACPVLWIGLDRLRWLRIGLAGQPSHGPVGDGASGDRHCVTAFGATFGDQQVPPSVALEQVRRLGILHPGSRPRHLWPVEHLARRGIDAEAGDVHRGVVHPAVAVVVPGDVGIDAGNRQRERIGPRAGGIVGGDDEVVRSGLRHHGGDEPEPSVVMAQRRREHTQRRPGGRVGQVELFDPVQGVADLRPVDEVGGAEDRHTGEPGERRHREEVLVADPTDRRIGVEARDHRIPETVRSIERGRFWVHSLRKIGRHAMIAGRHEGIDHDDARRIIHAIAGGRIAGRIDGSG